MEQDIGSLTPGRYADIVLLKDLKTIRPVLVMKDGRVVADENGAKPCPAKEYPAALFDTVHISPDFSENDLKIKASGQKALCHVIGMIKDQIINDDLHEWMDITDGEIRQDVSRDILKLSVVERYGKNGRVSNGLVKGFGLKRGVWLLLFPMIITTLLLWEPMMKIWRWLLRKQPVFTAVLFWLQMDR